MLYGVLDQDYYSGFHINCTVKGYKVLSPCFMMCWIKINILALYINCTVI